MICFNLQLRRSLWVAMLSLALTSCLSPANIEQEKRYIVNETPSVKKDKWRRSVSVMVQLPSIYPAFDTQKIAYTVEPYLIDYYGYSFWVTNPAHMLQPLLVKTLQDSNHYRAVITPPFVGHYQYLLMTQILDFKMNYTRYAPVFDFKMRLQLVNMSSYQILGTKDIRIVQPMTMSSPTAGVYAANKAVDRALIQVERFVAKNIK